MDRIFDLKANGMTVLNDANLPGGRGLVEAARKAAGRSSFYRTVRTRRAVRAQIRALRAALAVNATIYSVDMSAPDLNPSEKAANRGALSTLPRKPAADISKRPAAWRCAMRFTGSLRSSASSTPSPYQPANLTKDGKWRAIKLVVSRPNLTIRTRKGYNAPKSK